MSSNTNPEPQDAQGYFDRGVTYLEKGELDNAIADFSKAIELNPKYADAYFNRGFAYENKGELDNAFADYDKAIKLNPRNADACAARGLAYGKKGELDNAIADFNKAIALNPRHANAYFNRGTAYIEKEELGKAIADFSKAIALNPQDANAYFNRGIAYGKKEEWDNAIANYGKAIDLNPQDADAYFNRGLAYLRKEEWDNAIVDFDTAMGLDPQHPLAYLMRGSAYIRKEEQASKGTVSGNAVPNLTEVIRNITHELSHEAQGYDFAHYTSLDTLKNLVDNGRFRLYNSAYMNDPEEGHIFFEIMNKIINARKEEGSNYNLEEMFYRTDDNMPYRSPAYIGSFIPLDREESEDNLLLWRTYGKQNGKEAAGSCLIFPEKYFAKDHRRQIGNMKTASTDINLEAQDRKPPIDNNIHELPIYNIIYVDKDRKIPEENEKLAGYLEEIGDIIEKIPDDVDEKTKRFVRERLDRIRFLFKASHYKEEREVRVLQPSYLKEDTGKNSDETKVDAEQIPPCFYLEAPESFCFSEVILGPQVEHFQEWKRWIEDRDTGIAEQRPSVKVRESGIKYGK